MKKKCILALILGAAFMAQGCGYTEGTDAVVTVVDSTPTPEPTEAPAETPTPEPKAADSQDGAAASTDAATADASATDGAAADAAQTDTTAQAAATEQTPSGINVQAQDATYYAVEGVNLRSDASPDADFVAGVLSGDALKCTGVCDNGWIRVDYNGQTCYASGDYVSTTPPVGATAVDTTAVDTTADAASDTAADVSSDTAEGSEAEAQ